MMLNHAEDVTISMQGCRWQSIAKSDTSTTALLYYVLIHGTRGRTVAKPTCLCHAHKFIIFSELDDGPDGSVKHEIVVALRRSEGTVSLLPYPELA